MAVNVKNVLTHIGSIVTYLGKQGGKCATDGDRDRTSAIAAGQAKSLIKRINSIKDLSHDDAAELIGALTAETVFGEDDITQMSDAIDLAVQRAEEQGLNNNSKGLQQCTTFGPRYLTPDQQDLGADPTKTRVEKLTMIVRALFACEIWTPSEATKRSILAHYVEYFEPLLKGDPHGCKTLNDDFKHTLLNLRPPFRDRIQTLYLVQYPESPSALPVDCFTRIYGDSDGTPDGYFTDRVSYTTRAAIVQRKSHHTARTDASSQHTMVGHYRPQQAGQMYMNQYGQHHPMMQCGQSSIYCNTISILPIGASLSHNHRPRGSHIRVRFNMCPTVPIPPKWRFCF